MCWVPAILTYWLIFLCSSKGDLSSSLLTRWSNSIWLDASKLTFEAMSGIERGGKSCTWHPIYRWTRSSAVMQCNVRKARKSYPPSFPPFYYIIYFHLSQNYKIALLSLFPILFLASISFLRSGLFSPSSLKEGNKEGGKKFLSLSFFPSFGGQIKPDHDHHLVLLRLCGRHRRISLSLERGKSEKILCL